MTHQEAIDIIAAMYCDHIRTEQQNEACRMAMEALKVVEALEAMLKMHEALDLYFDKGQYGVMTEAENLMVDRDTLSAAILEAAKKL